MLHLPSTDPPGRCPNARLGWAALLGFGLLALGAPAWSAPSRHALLIGVADYHLAPKQVLPWPSEMNGQPKPGLPRLAGPKNDVVELRRLLINTGFPESNIISLVDAQATRQAILDALGQLNARSQPGDLVFIYFSGHGTSTRDEKSTMAKELPYTSGALYPFDFKPENSAAETVKHLLRGRLDIKPRLETLDRGQRQVLFIADACFSGEVVRGNPPGKRHDQGSRYQPITIDLGGGEFGSGTVQAEKYPYRNVFFISASGEDETAEDIGDRRKLERWPTLDNQYHGALTDALLRALSAPVATDSNRDGMISNDELYRAIRGFMDGRKYGHTPNRLPTVEEDTANQTGLGKRAFLTRGETGKVKPEPSPNPAPSPQPPPEDPTLLRVSLPATADARLREAVAGLPGVRLGDAAPNLLLRQEARGWAIRSPAGELVTLASDQTAVLNTLRQQRWLRQLQSETPAQTFNLTLDLKGNRQGGYLVEGEAFRYVLTVEKPAYVVLLNFESQGKVNVLYPFDRGEMVPLAANRLLNVPVADDPNDQIKVQEPFGSELMLALGFEKVPPPLEALLGQSIAPDSPRRRELDSLLTLARQQGAARAALWVVTQPLIPSP